MGVGTGAPDRYLLWVLSPNGQLAESYQFPDPLPPEEALEALQRSKTPLVMVRCKDVGRLETGVVVPGNRIPGQPWPHWLRRCSY
jgi:hypothetical protein